MSNLITGIIPKQNFELIRDKIGAIIALEFAAQVRMNPELQPTTYWSERYIPFDTTDVPAINIVFPEGQFDRQDFKTVEGNYTYHIECWNKAKSTAVSQADKLSTVGLVRMLGICRAILENPQYIKLGLSTVGRVTVTGLGVGQSDAMDSTSATFGRLTVQVRTSESTQLLEGELFEGSDSVVTLELTDNGYQYTFNA